VREAESMLKSKPRRYGHFFMTFNNLDELRCSTLGHYCTQASSFGDALPSLTV
jgi:hypothetical protein